MGLLFLFLLGLLFVIYWTYKYTVTLKPWSEVSRGHWRR